MVAHDPLHRSGRAVLPHPAPALGHSAKSHQRIRLTDTRRGKPSIDIPLHAFPAQAIILTPAAKNPPPKTAHRPSKRADAFDVHRHPIVTDVSKDHRSQIASNLRDGKMHAPLQFTLELLKLCLPPLAHRLPQHRKPSLTRLPTDRREAKKVEGLGLSLSTPLTVLCRVAAKLYQGASSLDAVPDQIRQIAAEVLSRTSPLPLDARSPRRNRLQSAPPPHRRTPACISIAGPRGQRHSAGTRWPTAD
jgi:hypothetical protein